MIIEITESAEAHLTKMVADQSALGFRLSLKKTGCSGFAYVPEIIKTINANDIHFMKNNLNIYIDPTHKDFLMNVIVDYLDDNKTGLKQKRLVFINPNEKNRCGCGESFTTE